MKNLPDADLFGLVQQDNERAFSILFDRYKAFTFRHIYKRMDSEYEASETLQNIFLSLWKNRSSIVVEDSLAPYLLGAARNCIFEFYANNHKKLRRQNLLLGKEELVEYPVEDYIIVEEVEMQLKRELEKMPITMKKAFELSRNENLPVKEIAAILKVSEQTVKNNLTMALHRLRGKFKISYFVK